MIRFTHHVWAFLVGGNKKRPSSPFQYWELWRNNSSGSPSRAIGQDWFNHVSPPPFLGFRDVPQRRYDLKKVDSMVINDAKALTVKHEFVHEPPRRPEGAATVEWMLCVENRKMRKLRRPTRMTNNRYGPPARRERETAKDREAKVT